MSKNIEPVILALDQGTTSSRAIAFDARANILSISQKPLQQYFPKDGWVEQCPRQIWETQFGCLSEVLHEIEKTHPAVCSLGITNQRETTIVWDKESGEPVYNAIVWQDRRTAQLCQTLHLKGYEPLIREKTGLRLDPYFSATKIAWILENVPDARAKAEQGKLLFGTVDSWLIWKLTKGRCHITDMTNASRTLLFNLHTKEWDEELLDIFSIPKSMLPTIVESSGYLAQTDESVTGKSIPICGAAGDQQAATFGQACFKAGMAKNTYGTGGFLLMNTEHERPLSENKLLSTVAWSFGGKTTYALEGSVFVAGAVVQWLRDNLSIIGSSDEVESLAATVEDNGGVYMVPAFVGLGAPHWDPYARGLIMGLTRASTRAHLARAALESIAFQCNDVLISMQRDAKLELKELRVDGGASTNDILMQFQADISGVPVVRPSVTETTALGAAYLAGLACKVWSSEEEISTLWRREKVFEPSMSKDRQEHLFEQWTRAVARAKGWEQ